MFRWWVKRLLICATILMALGVVTMVVLSRPMPPHPFVMHAGPLVIAHRGGRGLWPESTLWAFDQAARMGVDVLEMDVQRTADSVLVVLHDDTVDRTTDGTGRIADLTLAEAGKLDAGFRWTLDNGKTFPYRGRGITIPALEEVLRAFPAMRLNIEIKPDESWIVDRLRRAVRTFGHPENILVASFHPRIIKDVRKKLPGVATAAVTSDAAWFWLMDSLRLGAAYQPVANAFQVPARIDDMEVITDRFIEGAHRHNMVVHAWTIDDRREMKRLLRLGVDGIMTNYPDRLLAILGRAVPEIRPEPASQEPAAETTPE